MNAQQIEVNKFIQENHLECSTESRLLDLVSEVGELSKEVLNGNAYGSAPFSVTPNFTEELGDVYFSLLALANATQVDLNGALRVVLEKYSERIARAGTASSLVK